MTFLPIVERELRVSSRRRTTYWGRFVSALAAMGLAALVLASMDGEPAAGVGEALFLVFSFLVFIYTAGVGIGATYDCLSAEKREGTLGLLYLTDLKGYDVVMGKLAAAGISGFYYMLAVVPILGICFLLGSVTNGQFWRVVLVAINLLLFMMSAGLLASAVCRRESRALVMALVLASVIFGAAPILVLAWNNGDIDYNSSLILLLTPGLGCFTAFDDLYKSAGGKSLFWCNTAVTILYSSTFFCLASSIVRRSWQDEVVKPNLRPKSPADVSAAESAAVRRRRLEINPYLWRATPGSFGTGRVFVVLLVATIIFFGLEVIMNPNSKMSPGDLLCWIFILNTVLKILLARAASRAFSEDRRSGAFELVLTTPLSGAEIVRGQRLALRAQFGPPTITVLVVNGFCWFIWALSEPSAAPGDSGKSMLWAHVLLATFLLMDLNALGWTGMWNGLKARKPGRPAVMALLQVVVPPWLALAVAASLYNLFLPQSNFDWLQTCVVVSVAGVIADLWAGENARWKLHRFFRGTVADLPRARGKLK